MITDTFIAELREAFRVFGIDEDIGRNEPHYIYAGGLGIQLTPQNDDDDDPPPFFDIFIYDTFMDMIAEVPEYLPRTAIMAVVEWHLSNPRQAVLPFDRE